MEKIAPVLQSAQQSLLTRLGLPPNEARLEAQLLLQHVLNANRAWLIAHENDTFEASVHTAFEALLKRRLSGEPIAYILGCREFYGLKLKVTPATLIPRPDTETLVEAALTRIPQHQTCKILDLGTGTGAIALAIAYNHPQARVTAVDASVNALQIAKENAQNLQLGSVRLMQSNWFAALHKEKFDVIVSNPPYIAENDIHLIQGDLPWEPISALAAGPDGLNDIRQIIADAPQHLNPHGWLLLEHGYDQAGRVADLLKESRFGSIATVKDLSGNDRVTLGQLV